MANSKEITKMSLDDKYDSLLHFVELIASNDKINIPPEALAKQADDLLVHIGVWVEEDERGQHC